MTWDTPITQPEGWMEALVPYWHHVLAWVDGPRQDALGAQAWTGAKELLDALRDPTPDEVNARWREFIVAVWILREAWLLRVARQRARIRR